MLTEIICPADQWTLLKSSLVGDITIHKLKLSPNYIYMIVPTGDSAPVNNDGAGALFENGLTDGIACADYCDVYIKALKSDGSVSYRANVTDVAYQDQHSPALFIKASEVFLTTALSADASIDDESITLDDVTGIIQGTYIGIFNTNTNRYYVGEAIAVPVGNVVQLDRPLDSDFVTGDVVGCGITNMAVNGAITPRIFTLRGADPGIDVKGDITRILLYCETASAVSLNLFGDLAALTKGLMIRRRDGLLQNIVVWKTNGEIAGSMFDWTPYDANNPVFGIDGFVSRLTFAGPEKIGVVIRIKPGEDLEFHVRDDLSGLTKLEVMTEGHVVV